MKKRAQRQRKKSGAAKKALIGFLAIGLIGSFGKASEPSTVPASSAVPFSEVSTASLDLSNGLAEEMAHLDFPEVGTYEGTLQDGKRSGNGTFMWADGTSYAGAWADDQINGEGVVTTPNGTTWTGSFAGNAFQNTAYSVKGSNFRGTVTLAEEKNQATLTFTCPDPLDATKTVDVLYSGDLTKTGEFSGNANIGYPNGDSYAGSVSNGQKTNGKYVFQNGDTYTGTFKADKMCDGSYVFATGQILTGHFENGIPSGELTYTVNGVKYKTTWQNGACVSIAKA